jgi:hypothetical protein
MSVGFVEVLLCLLLKTRMMRRRDALLGVEGLRGVVGCRK